MGNLIKINMYAESKRKKKRELKLENVEKAILKYNKWLQKNHRQDKIENYEEFLHAQ